MQNDKKHIDKIGRAEIEKYLSMLLKSNALGGSERLERLLQYLVDEELAGNGERIKSYSIALDVYKKSEDFDPASSSIIRVEMHRLKKALDLFHATCADDISVELFFEHGSYRPHFRRKENDQHIANPIQNDTDKQNPLGYWAHIIFGNRIARTLAVFSLIALMGFGVYHFVIKTGAVNCDKPNIIIAYEDSPYFTKEKMLTTMRRIAQSYSLVAISDQSLCSNTPNYFLQMEVVKNNLEQSIEASIKTNRGDRGYFWLRRFPIKDLENKKELELVLNQIAYKVFYFEGVVPSDAVTISWQNTLAKQHYQCQIKGYYALHSYDVDQQIEAIKCMEKYADNIESASFLGIYARLLLLVENDYIDYEMDDPVAKYQKTINRALAINPSDFDTLITRLMEFRFERNFQFYRIKYALYILSNKSIDNPAVLNEIAKIQACSVNNVVAGEAFLNRSMSIMRNSHIHFYARICIALSRHNWPKMHDIISDEYRPDSSIAAIIHLATGVMN